MPLDHLQPVIIRETLELVRLSLGGSRVMNKLSRSFEDTKYLVLTFDCHVFVLHVLGEGKNVLD